MFRFLIVEDIESARTELQKLFGEVLPDSRVDVAEHVEEALSYVARAVKERWVYDCVILDFMLPCSKGEEPEMDFTVCQAIRNDMPMAFVIHFTAFAAQTEVLEHLVSAHIGRRDPRADLVPKESDYATELIGKVRKYLFTTRLDEHMDEVFGPSRSRHPQGRQSGTADMTSAGSTTHRLAALQREIEACWNDLDDQLKERVKRFFVVDEGPKEVRVDILLNARGFEAEDRP